MVSPELVRKANDHIVPETASATDGPMLVARAAPGGADSGAGRLHQPQRPAVAGHQPAGLGRPQPAGLLADQRLAHRAAQAQGMDPAVLAAIPGNVVSLHPEVRSLLVVRRLPGL